MGSISLRQVFHRGFSVYFGGSERSSPLGHKPEGLLSLVFLWQDRMRQRHQLAEMDDYMLRDIGLSRADAERESRKHFWRA